VLRKSVLWGGGVGEGGVFKISVEEGKTGGRGGGGGGGETNPEKEGTKQGNK